jgi:Pyruvate/2-oxoacid:ferredoxin oxidoreductase delta subunit
MANLIRSIRRVGKTPIIMIRKSTKYFWMLQGEGARGMLRVLNMVHGYIYYTLYDRYVVSALVFVRFLTGNLPNFFLTGIASRFFSDRYHAKVMTFENAKRLVTLEQELRVPLEESKRIIPFELANKLIFNHKDHIALVDCPCRLDNLSRGIEACLPLNTCMFLGRTSVDFVTTHMPRMHGRRVTAGEAVELLEQQHRRGVSFNLWFKDATGYRGGVLCSCCSCCCKGAEASRIFAEIESLKDISLIAPSGHIARRDRRTCRGCGDCATVCPYGALIDKGTGHADGVLFAAGQCKGCGACAAICKNRSITMVRDSGKGEVLDIDVLADTYS